MRTILVVIALALAAFSALSVGTPVSIRTADASLITVSGGAGSGPLPSQAAATVLFSDDFDSYSSDFTIDGSCRWESDASCSGAVFPKDSQYGKTATGGGDGWTFLVCSGGSNTTNTCADINADGGRTGRGIKHYDESEHELGGSQWGHDLQLLKVFPEEHAQLWAEFDARFEVGNPLVNQKIIHFFHYDRSWFEDPSTSSISNTSESTDGGFICNWNKVVDTEVEIRCFIRHANPPAYKPGSGLTNTNDGGDTTYNINTQGYRFDILAGESCTAPADSGPANFWADGTWRKLIFGAQLNSAIGVADGWFEVWLDDCKLGRLTDIPWKQSGTENDHGGFNGVSVGGNAQNNDWGADEEEMHTWSIDNVQMCTEKC